MNTIIKEIIDADRAAQQAVQKANEEREAARNMMTSKREEIYEAFMKDSQEEIEQKKRELKTIFEKEKRVSEQKYQFSLDALQQLFDEKKDEWVNAIVDSCLK